MDAIFTVIYILVLVAVIVFLDFMYLRYDFKKRLISNIIIVLVFAAFYVLFLK